MLYSSGPYLPTKIGSGAATCPTALDPASLLRWTPALPRVHRLWTTPPDQDGLRSYHVPLRFGPRFPVGKGYGIFACPTTLGPASLLGTQLGSRVSKASSRVTKALARRADMWRHHSLQDMRSCRYSVAQWCSVARLTTHRHGRQGM
jgi:hypothetical protein